MSICFHDILMTDRQDPWLTSNFKGFCLDSRDVKSQQIFIALGSYSQPEKTVGFAKAALEKGALAIISEQPLLGVDSLVVADVRQKMGTWQKQYLQACSEQNMPKVIAVTGTNGKTTISRLVAELLMFSDQRCAVMGTTGNGILPHLTASTHTTVDALKLQSMLLDYAQLGAHWVSLEASSHGLDQGRLVGCEIEVAVYSNLSHDHLDYHHTLADYAAAKAKLFAFESLKVAVINVDDSYANVMLQAAKKNPAQPKVFTYSCHDVNADFYVSNIVFALDGVHFDLRTAQGTFNLTSPLLGQFNIDNLVASLAAVSAIGVDLDLVCNRLHQLIGAPGRMQVIRAQDRTFIVDYAHTPDALQQALKSIKKHVNGRLWVVFGCGGDRDRVKRAMMTRSALECADVSILTSDNPRTEAVQRIFSDMIQGIDFQGKQAYQIENRRDAIDYAVQQAKAGDIVLIAGKGHENYQDIAGIKHYFDDVIEVKNALEHSHTIRNNNYMLLG